MEDMKLRVSPQSALERTCVQHPCQKRPLTNWKDACGICVCLISFGVCVLLYLRTSDLQSRVLSLEKDRDPRISSWISVEQVEPVLWSRLDQILEEKLAARLPKIRAARDAPHNCICPP
ncbi:hypothetical protein cypCar_00007706, partial [Cyprinus carpio]